MVNAADGGFLPGDGFDRSCYAPEWRQEVGKVDEGKQQSCNPEGMLMRQQTEQTQHGDNVELNFLRLVRHSLRERMDRQEDDSGSNNAANDHHHHNIEEYISIARRRDEKWKVRCRQWIGCCR
jgi:hypothetical protein